MKKIPLHHHYTDYVDSIATALTNNDDWDADEPSDRFFACFAKALLATPHGELLRAHLESLNVTDFQTRLASDIKQTFTAKTKERSNNN